MASHADNLGLAGAVGLPSSLVRLAGALLCFACHGCSGARHGPPDDADVGDASEDADSTDDADGDGDEGGDADELPCDLPVTQAVDVLLVWDNAGVGAAQQELFLDALEGFEAELSAETSLRVGAVTTDLGSNGVRVMGCDEEGEQGILRACEETDSTWYTGKGEGLRRFLGCVLPESDAGCGIEMFLEAARLALTTQSGPDMPNDGFLRDGSILVILFVGNEDDCSTDDYELFADDDDLGPLNTRCALHPDRLTDVQEYLDDIVALRAECPGRVVVGGVIGVPAGWDGDLSAPELVPRPSEDPNRLVRVCDEGFDLWADPAPRLALFAVSTRSAGHVASACFEDEYVEALRALGRRIAHLVGD